MSRPVETKYPNTPAERVEWGVMELHIIRDLVDLAEEIAGELGNCGLSMRAVDRDRVAAINWATEKLLTRVADDFQSIANVLKESEHAPDNDPNLSHSRREVAA